MIRRQFQHCLILGNGALEVATLPLKVAKIEQGLQIPDIASRSSALALFVALLYRNACC